MKLIVLKQLLKPMEIAQPEAFRQQFPQLWDQLAAYVKQ